jgi:hypothetical protein
MRVVSDINNQGKWLGVVVDGVGRAATMAFALHTSLLNRVTKRQNWRSVYLGCTVHEEFVDFQSFAAWCHRQTGYARVDENGRPWVLDKDLIFKGNAMYGPENCAFIPSELNALIKKNRNKAGGLPGVNKSGRISFTTCCSDHLGRNHYLGSFSSETDAFLVYKEFKEEVIKQKALKYKDCIDDRVFQSLMNWVVEPNDNAWFPGGTAK